MKTKSSVGIHIACMVIMFDFCVLCFLSKEKLRETIPSILLKWIQTILLSVQSSSFGVSFCIALVFPWLIMVFLLDGSEYSAESTLCISAEFLL